MKKILSLAITLMLVLSIASIPAMAADLPTDVYEGGSLCSDLTSGYTYEQFTDDFKDADYTAFEDFEEAVPSGYTAVDAYSGNTGRSSIYPYEMAVSNVQGGTFSLKLNDTTGNKLLNVFTKGNTNIGDLSSGNYAILAGYTSLSGNIAFVGKDTDDNGNVYNVVKVNGEAKEEYKISAIGFALKYGSGRKPMDLVVTYDNGSTETVRSATPAGSTRNRSHFCGVKAPEGTYITGLTIISADADDETKKNTGSFIIDDLGIIFDKEVIFPDGAYNLGVGSSMTDYTYEQFTDDFKDADYTAFEKFETFSGDYDVYTGNDGLTGGHKSMTFAPTVSGVDNATFSLTLKPTIGTLGMFEATGTGNPSAVSSGDYALLTVKSTGLPGGIKMTVADTDNVIMVGGEAQSDYKIKALGFVVQYGSKREKMTYTVTYDSGDPLTVTTEQLESPRTSPRFFGFKAPEGKYITGVTIDTENSDQSFVIDDLGIIFDKEVVVPDISFSTDATGANVISSLADVTGDVYVNIAANAFENKKVILALYGENEELLDVAVANAGAEKAQALAQVPAGESLTSIKAFVWDFANGLIPVQAPFEING